MKNVTRIMLVAATVAIVGTLVFGTAHAQKKKDEKKRAAATKHLMKGIVFANCKALGDALKKEETDWDDIGVRAGCLNEAGHFLMDDKRCPSAEWAKACKTLQGCSVVILAKVKDKDLEGTKSAFGALTKGCGTCHTKHRKKK